MRATALVSSQSKLHIHPRLSRKIIKKADLLVGTAQSPLKLRNKALLSLDGGGLRGIISGELFCAETSLLKHMQAQFKPDDRAGHCEKRPL